MERKLLLLLLLLLDLLIGGRGGNARRHACMLRLQEFQRLGLVLRVVHADRNHLEVPLL